MERPRKSRWGVGLAAAVLALAACTGPEPNRGYAPRVLPAQAELLPVAGARGGAVALLVETERGVLLRVVATRLQPGEHELVLAPDEDHARPLERLGSLRVGDDGFGNLELEMEWHTLTAGSALLGRELVLVAPDRSLLRGLIDKGVDLRDAASPPGPSRPPGPSKTRSPSRP